MPKRQTNKFKHKIDVLGNVATVNELNEKSFRFEKIKSIWSDIVPQTGSLQKQAADTILANVTHKIIVRYSAGKIITKDMQLHFRGHKFDINYILNPYFKNETLEIFCTEVIK
ncbi:phage head closure protein [Cytobacillus praedii]|uniref:phage head closure protein n=1 Tax=Cytobacillus praedii TaxID=1742358 RepID=UPI002E1ED673|nr:phage head closure protein [Cytobacillus praedii]MED3549963.1 phage head closure protein [Cytobacillus praedii]